MTSALLEIKVLSDLLYIGILCNFQHSFYVKKDLEEGVRFLSLVCIIMSEKGQK